MYIDKSIIKIILLYSTLLSERTVALAFFYMYPLEGLYERKYVNSDCPNIPVFLEILNPDQYAIGIGLFWYFQMNSYDSYTRTPNRVYSTETDILKTLKKKPGR